MAPPKMSRYRRRQILLDKLHVGFVTCCMAMTVVASGLTVYRAYHFFRNRKPEIKESQTYLEEQLLSEGKFIQESNTESVLN